MEAEFRSEGVIFRPTRRNEIEAVLALYKAAAALQNGLARTADEFSLEFVSDFFSQSQQFGLSLVAEHEGEIIAEIHGFPMQPKCFKSCLSNLMIAVHPRFRSRGIGKKLFLEFLSEIKVKQPQIARVELFVRSKNALAIALYKSLGFAIEGVLKNRIIASDGELDDDVLMALVLRTC